ncbi:MAG TPA: hypothetical protein VGI47_00795 [Candidatus Binataceae bacterium]
MKTSVFILVSVFLIASSLVNGAVISTSLGNTAPGFANNSIQTTAAVNTAQTGQPAPFTGNCGSDATTNCSASWTFNYSVPSGQTVTAATLVLGIWDIDSGAPGNQVASYLLTGGDNLTSSLNMVAEALNSNLGSNNSEYDVLSVTIPNTSFGQLALGTAQISLALQGPGLGVIANNNPQFNGAKLVFSTLTLETSDGMQPTPEPSFITLVPIALGAFAFFRRRRQSF